MKLVSELIEDKDYQLDLQKQEANLEILGNDISLFFSILQKNRFKNFIDLLSDIGFSDSYQNIKNFLEDNHDFLEDNRVNNFELDYFINLLNYFSNNLINGSLYEYENKFLEEIELNKLVSYENIKEKLDEIIDFLIESIDDELFYLENGINSILEGELIKFSDDIPKILLLEDKKTNLKNSFENIIKKLLSRDKESIGFILDSYSLLGDQENLYYFVIENEENIKKIENGDLVFDLIIYISDNMFEKSFSDLLKDYYLESYILYSLNYIFNDILEEVFYQD